MMEHDARASMPQDNAAPTHAGTSWVRTLNSAQLQRIKDGRRLAETKLRHVEESLQRLRKQQEWLRRHKQLQMELDQQKSLLFQCSKRQAALDAEARLLARHEQVEGVIKKVIRQDILERMSDYNTSEQGQQEQEARRLMHRQDELVNQKRQAADRRKQSEECFSAIQDGTFQACRLEGAREATEAEIQHLSEMRDKVVRASETIAGEIRKHSAELEVLAQELGRHRAGRQSMEMHEPMLMHAESVLLRLDMLLESKELQEDMLAQKQEVARTQQEENQTLSRLYAQYRDITSQAETLEAELQMHRSSTKGQDSYAMQEHAMRLKAKGQMLLSAESLWERIAAGYNAIEEKQVRLDELRLHIEHTEARVKALEEEAGKAQRISREKEYTYLLSKGQNVVQLRAGLHEGTACSVCGARHHPYHCDTMLEQSKLIGDFKTDYELLEAEAQGKQKQLEELRVNLAESKGERKGVEEALENLRSRQSEDVKEWGVFAPLDRSFRDCTSSTNQEARKAMIRQLRENTSRNSELAQKELDAFNFHHAQIASLSESLQQLEQRKDELSTRLEEVNTACQVMAGRAERLQERIDKERKRYSRIYEQTDKAITITDWLREWRDSPEGLKGRIQQMASAWETINRQIGREEQEWHTEQTVLEELARRQEAVSQWADALQKRIEACRTRAGEDSVSIMRLAGKDDPRAPFREAYKQFLQALSEEAQASRDAEQVQSMADRARGKSDFCTQLEQEHAAMLADGRAEIDVWIHNFNTQNSPIQYAELEQMAQDNRDWHQLRARVQESVLQTALCQERVDSLNSRIVSLQAEGGKAGDNEEETLVALAGQQEMLERQRRDITLQIARADIILEAQEHMPCDRETCGQEHGSSRM